MSLGMRICISSLIFSLLQLIKILLLMFNHSVVSNSLWPHGLQHARLPCPSPTPGSCPNSCPWSQWCHPTISPSVAPSTPAFSLSQDQGLIKWVRSSHKVAKVLELQLQHQFFQWIFSINFLVLCLHYGPVFLVVMYRCESWTIAKADGRSIDAFKLWCWRGLLRVLGLQGDQTSQS